MILICITLLARAADAEVGKALYQANCTACHGLLGDGKGPAAVALKPKPTDLTAEAFWTGRVDATVAGAIRTGKPGTSMTAFTQFSEIDVENLVAYLRSFAPAAP